jgi:hypothetical protein
VKKAFAITLLVLFVFQFVGYYFIYVGLRYHAKSELLSRLDAKDYSSEETITLRIPFTLPYWMDSRGYERVNGEFQYQGEFYHLVEQKLEKDTLYVVCIKDANETRLHGAMADYVKLTNDIPTSSQKNVKLFGSLMKDYVKGTGTVILKIQDGWSQEHLFGNPSFRLLSLSSPVYSPPPEC